VKQALIVDPQGAVEDFASSALGLYEQTTARSLQEAAALASGAEYDLVLIAKPAEICDGAMWTMVERIAKLASGAAFVMIHTEAGDAAFHARAAALGVTVVTTPLGVMARRLIDEVTAG
jgi:hypothetical protein